LLLLLFNQFFRFGGGVEIGNCYIKAVPGKPLREGLTDSGGSAGNDCHAF
jgi:hypothetical protein